MNAKLSMINCHLCANMPCAKACKKLDLDKILLGVWFDNESYVASTLPNKNPCVSCSGPCAKACVSKHVFFKELINDLYRIKKQNKKAKLDYKSLKTKFFSKTMDSPFMLSSSVVSSSYEKIARALKLGWAGVVLKTISYIHIQETSPRYHVLKTRINTFRAFRNIEQLSTHAPEHDMQVLARLKKQFPNKIIVASIMGRDKKEWQKLALMAQKAGADAIELNFSCPNMEEKDTGSAIGQQPEAVKRFTKAVKQVVRIPVLAKLTPNVQDICQAALAAKSAKVDGLSAINTIKSIIKTQEGPITVGGLSGQAVRPIALRFISDIKSNPKLKNMYISGIGGIETYINALDYMILGASSLQITTAVMEYGYRIIQPLKDGLAYFMAANGIKNTAQIIGWGLKNLKQLDTLDRQHVIYPKFDRTKCIKCGRCYISCRDGGQDALTIDKKGYPILNPKKCAGCHLCTFVCPTGACQSSKIKSKRI